MKQCTFARSDPVHFSPESGIAGVSATCILLTDPTQCGESMEVTHCHHVDDSAHCSTLGWANPCQHELPSSVSVSRQNCVPGLEDFTSAHGTGSRYVDNSANCSTLGWGNPVQHELPLSVSVSRQNYVPWLEDFASAHRTGSRYCSQLLYLGTKCVDCMV